MNIWYNGTMMDTRIPSLIRAVLDGAQAKAELLEIVRADPRALKRARGRRVQDFITRVTGLSRPVVSMVENGRLENIGAERLAMLIGVYYELEQKDAGHVPVREEGGGEDEPRPGSHELRDDSVQEGAREVR